MSWLEIEEYYKAIKRKIDSLEYTKINNAVTSFKYDRFRKAEDGIIFNGIKNIEIGNKNTICIGFSINANTLERLMIFFSRFLFKNSEYVAFLLNSGLVVFLKIHSISRYLERNNGYVDKSRSISDTEIAKCLIYNSSMNLISLDFQNLFFSCREGVFLGDNKRGVTIINTFVTKQMLFSDQKEIDLPSMETLRKYMQNEYGQTI